MESATPKRKVLFVAHHLTIGGAQKSMVTALKALDYDKNDVTLYVRKKRLNLLPEIDERVRVIINDDETHYYRNAYAPWKILQIEIYKWLGQKEKAGQLQEQLSDRIRDRMLRYESKRFFEGCKYDVAITYIQGYTADLAAYGIEADRKVLFYHSSTDEAHSFHEKVFSQYDTIVAVGDEIKRILIDLYPQYNEKIQVLYNYVDDRAIRRKAEENTADVPHDRTVLCSCGRLNPVKGFDLAIRAARILKERGETFVWYFVGDGPEREKLESMIRENVLEENVVITGMQSNPYPWINACDIYVQPSYEEAHGLSVVEAEILCKPVVTTATVGGKYLVQDGINGLVCEINEAALADGIQHLIASPAERNAIAERLDAVDYAKEYEKYIKKWEELLEG